MSETHAAANAPSPCRRHGGVFEATERKPTSLFHLTTLHHTDSAARGGRRRPHPRRRIRRCRRLRSRRHRCQRRRCCHRRSRNCHRRSRRPSATWSWAPASSLAACWHCCRRCAPPPTGQVTVITGSSLRAAGKNSYTPNQQATHTTNQRATW